MENINIYIRYARLIILFLLFSAVLNAQDFRQFHWQDSMEDVKSKEGDGIYTEFKGASPNILNYMGISLGDEIWDLTYWFSNGKLIAGGYSREYSDADNSDMKRSLTRKYGKPDSDNKWVTKTTVIMYLTNPNKLTILYVSKYKLDEFKSVFHISDNNSLEGI